MLVLPVDTLCTQESRKALRPEIPRADAVYSLQRSALLVDLLATGALDLLPRALSDRLHEPDRAALAPLLGRLRDLDGALPCLGVTLSGAGPSVLVWVREQGTRGCRRGGAGLRAGGAGDRAAAGCGGGSGRGVARAMPATARPTAPPE